jgi:hypothetical protein
LDGCRVARVFFVQTYQNGKNIPNDHKLHIPKLPHCHKILQLVIKYTNNFNSMALQNVSNSDFWNENKPSGNLVRRFHIGAKSRLLPDLIASIRRDLFWHLWWWKKYPCVYR